MVKSSSKPAEEGGEDVEKVQTGTERRTTNTELIETDCRQTSEGFVVLKGHIEKIDSDSIPPGIKESQQKAVNDENGILQEDVLFRSPSYAAAFVIGGHANGLTEWKTDEGKTLKDIEGS